MEVGATEAKEVHKARQKPPIRGNFLFVPQRHISIEVWARNHLSYSHGILHDQLLTFSALQSKQKGRKRGSERKVESERRFCEYRRIGCAKPEISTRRGFSIVQQTRRTRRWARDQQCWCKRPPRRQRNGSRTEDRLDLAYSTTKPPILKVLRTKNACRVAREAKQRHVHET